MKIYGLEKMSLVDYDGKVSATVFTGSCNFRCPFCHNAALVVDYNKIEPIAEQEIFSYLKKRQGILDGVCISGGEPTLCADLPEFCKKIKELGYSVKLDTNGTNPKMIELLAKEKLCDYFAMDIKNDLASYPVICGLEKLDTDNIEKSVEFFLNGKVDYEFRTTLINEYHKQENIIEISKWIKGANKYFLQKFVSGDNCLTLGLTSVNNEKAIRFKNLLTKNIPNTSLRGYDDK